MGDAVSHSILPGIVLAYVLGAPLLLGAFAAGLLCAVATGYIKDNSRVKEDAVMGIVFSGMFALGLILIAKVETHLHLMHILFGNILGVSQYDLVQSTIIAVICCVMMLLKRKDLMLYCYDETHAKVMGLPVKLLHFGLLVLMSLSVVAALKAAGIILVIAMLIAPGAIGFLVTRKFEHMMFVAVLISIVSCVLGTYLSFYYDLATAPLIVVIQAGFLLIALCFRVHKYALTR